MRGDRHARALEAADAFAVEALRPSPSGCRGGCASLVAEIRRVAVRSGGALVAASAAVAGGDAERLLLERARTDLFRTRYYLVLARRMGLLDLERYRGLISRHAAALRELETAIAPSGQVRRRGPP